MGAEHIGVETRGLSFERDLDAIFARAPAPRRRTWPVALCSAFFLVLLLGAAAVLQFVRPVAVTAPLPQVATAPSPVPAASQSTAPTILPMTRPTAEIRQVEVKPEKRVARTARTRAARAEPGLVRPANATAMYAQTPTTSDREAVVIDEQKNGPKQDQAERKQRDARVAAIDAVRALRLH